jgi:predicted RNase H-like HicB family nuclease
LVGVVHSEDMDLPIETEMEVDGRWIAAVSTLPGVLVYGPTEAEAVQKVKALALRVIADRLDNGELTPAPMTVNFIAAA